MKGDEAIAVDEIWMQIVDEMNGALHLAALDALAYLDAFGERVRVVRVVDAGLGAELVGGLLEALGDQVVHDQLVHERPVDVAVLYAAHPLAAVCVVVARTCGRGTTRCCTKTTTTTTKS